MHIGGHCCSVCTYHTQYSGMSIRCVCTCVFTGVLVCVENYMVMYSLSILKGLNGCLSISTQSPSAASSTVAYLCLSMPLSVVMKVLQDAVVMVVHLCLSSR